MSAILSRLLGRRPEAPPRPAKAAAWRAMPIREARFVAFDTELTGLDFRRDSLVSVGAVAMSGGSILPAQAFHRLVRPASELRADSVVVHGITHSDLERHGEEAATVLADFAQFVGDAVLVGHCVGIDRHFLNRARKALGWPALANPLVDTAALHRWLQEQDLDFSRHHRGMTLKTDLFSMAKRYGVPVEEAHNALYDAFVTAQLLQRFLPFLIASGVDTVGRLLRAGKP
ncbi:MAG: 3'-5' exonuclease [Thermodesulfobacteriota bacterium]